MAAMTTVLSAPAPETTVVFAGSSAAAPSALTLTTAATALARASRLVFCCWRRSSFKTKTVNTDTMPTARAKTRTNASVRRPWNVLGRARETGTDKPRRRRMARSRDKGVGACDAVPGAGDLDGVAGAALPEEELDLLRFRPGDTSALREGVPRAADRQDEPRAGWIVFQLLAQVADVDVDRLFVLVQRLVIADELQQLAAGGDAAGLAGEGAQYLQLGAGQGDAPAAALDAPPLQIYQQVAVAEQAASAGIGQIAVGPPKQGLDAAHQFAQPKRLGHVVVCAQVQAD